MALIDDMREMSRLMGEILIASDKFLQDYKAKEAKRSELENSTNGTHSESKDTHDERGEGNVTVEAFAPERVR
ncbi:hypothetical protein CE91St14_03450 [Porphyromonas somerae]|nr:hypothetical protein CE91St14_03450 [Porphyromonas somerae]